VELLKWDGLKANLSACCFYGIEGGHFAEETSKMLVLYKINNA
jgi:hypothetical protein